MSNAAKAQLALNNNYVAKLKPQSSKNYIFIFLIRFITVIPPSKTLLRSEFHSLPRLTGAINAVRFLNPPLSLSLFTLSPSSGNLRRRGSLIKRERDFHSQLTLSLHFFVMFYLLSEGFIEKLNLQLWFSEFDDYPVRR